MKLMTMWYCEKCGQEVLAVERPNPVRWTDGHVCRFVPMPECELEAPEDDGYGPDQEWPPGAPKYR